MAEPIRKPLHRPRPPHPHAQVRPHAALVRSRPLPEDPVPETPRPAPAARPALVPPPERTAQPATPPTIEPALRRPAAFAPPDETLAIPRVSDERSARSLLLAALALHLGILLAAWFGQPASDLGPADLLLSGTVLLSGGVMLVLGSRR
jgi:hypothetical protein